MDKITSPRASARLKTGVLSTLLTAFPALVFCAFATLASACGVMVNDWKNHPIAPEASYSITRTAGASAHDLLQPEYFKSLVVEILAVPGFAPTQEALNRLQTFLERHLGKPNGIRLVMGPNLPSNESGTYSISQIRALEETHRRERPQVDQISVSILFVDGRSVDDEGSRKLLGQAHYNSSIVIYENTIRETVTTAGTPLWKTEATVMLHEFGHLLGLPHCDDTSCLMHFAVESGSTGNPLGDDEIHDLDEVCRLKLHPSTAQPH